MNVLALGGCGEMGRYAVRTLVENNFPGVITIADINEESSRKTAAKIENGVLWKKIDITDRQQIDQAMTGADMVINTVGPYYKFGMIVLEAAIRNKCHYIDICDDWEPTLELLSLDTAAKNAGISAIVGMGATPGVANLLAARVIQELESVDDVYIGWNLESAVSEPPNPEQQLEDMKSPDYQPNSAIIHGVQQLTGSIRVRRDGRFVDEKPIQKVMIDYPGLGRGRSWTIGHPEPLTLPHYFPQIKNCLNLFVGPQGTTRLIKLIAWLVNLRVISVRRAAIMVEKDEIKKRFWEKGSLDRDYKVSAGEQQLPGLFAIARGRHDGRTASVAATLLSAPPGKMAGVTGIPLAIGSRLMAEGKIIQKGVFAPEGGVDADTFFDGLAPLCSPAKKDGKDLILLTRSWDDTIPDFFKIN